MPKDKDTKFSEDELKKVKDIQQNYIDIQHRLGQLSVAEIRLEQQIDAIEGQRKNLTSTFAKNQKDEKEFIASVTEKYGDGVLNPKTGIYSKSEEIPTKATKK